MPPVSLLVVDPEGITFVGVAHISPFVEYDNATLDQSATFARGLVVEHHLETENWPPAVEPG
jgi:hypothetical protein